jgi:hypothetical protein
MTASRGTGDPVLERLGAVQGIVSADRLRRDHYELILRIEAEAEKRSILGMGKLRNSGLREVLGRQRTYVALTDMDFDWGCRSSLLLKKGEVVVGEEVHDEDTLRALKQTPHVWFMHDSFVIYKDRMSFPKDLADDSCRFEIPSLPAEWLEADDVEIRDSAPIYANPSPPCDLFLKQSYFPGHDEEGLGTILVGMNG